MPITRLLRGPKSAAEDGRAIVCAALALEAKIIEKQFAREVWGPDSADLSEFRAACDGCRGIVSYGVAGALCPDLRSGDIVVGSEIVGQNGKIPTDDVWSAWLLSSLPTGIYGPIAGVDMPVAAGPSRDELRLRSGALVADMESHVIAELAAAHGLRFVAVRIVIDTVDRNIPPTAFACVSSNSEASLWRVGRLLLGRPTDTLDMIKLWADWCLARRALLECCEVLGSSVHAIKL
jgi:hypothetical protein